MMLAEILNTMTGARPADTRGRRGVAALVRYVAVALVALSVIPASAAQTRGAAPDKSKPQGEAGSKQTQGQQQAEGKPAGQGVKLPPRVNAFPFKQLLRKGKALYDEGRLDLGRTISLSAEGDLAEDGTLSAIQMTGAADAVTIELAKDAVRALSASRVLAVLQGAPRVGMRFMLDPRHVSFTVQAEGKSERHAADTASSYRALIDVARFGKAGTAEAVIWNNMTASASGKQYALKLEMTRAEAGNLLLQHVAPN